MLEPVQRKSPKAQIYMGWRNWIANGGKLVFPQWGGKSIQTVWDKTEFAYPSVTCNLQRCKVAQRRWTMLEWGSCEGCAMGNAWCFQWRTALFSMVTKPGGHVGGVDFVSCNFSGSSPQFFIQDSFTEYLLSVRHCRGTRDRKDGISYLK